MDDDLSVLWRNQWPECPPLAHELKHAYRDRWVVTTSWSNDPEPPELSPRDAHWYPGAQYWTSVLTDEDGTDPDFVTYTHLYAGRTPWRAGSMDDLLRAAADDAIIGVMISLSFDRIHHPYDGGADVLLPTTPERDTMRNRHTDWLSAHPLGF